MSAPNNTTQTTPANAIAQKLDNLESLATALGGASWEAPSKTFSDAGCSYLEILDSKHEVVIGESGPDEDVAKFIAEADPATILSLVKLARIGLAKSSTSVLQASDELRKTVQPRPLRFYGLDDYWRAPSGEGGLAETYKSKPYQLIYDLIAALLAESGHSFLTMETAPKDGSEVFLVLGAPFSRYVLARWFEPLQNWQDGDFPKEGDEWCGIGDEVPVGWLPLPPPDQVQPNSNSVEFYGIKRAREHALREAIEICDARALHWHDQEGTYPAGKKAGAFDCADALRALLPGADRRANS